MQTIVKPVITALLALVAVTILITRTNVVTNQWSNDELDYALRVATQDATAVMMDKDYLFGAEEEASDFNIDLKAATAQFKRSFFDNIGSVLTDVHVNDMSVSLTGYAGYRYVYVTYASEDEPAKGFEAPMHSAVPFSYTYYNASDRTIYEFTLGDKVYATDEDTGVKRELLLSDLAENYFDAKISNESFRDITVMQTINDYLTMFYPDYGDSKYNPDNGGKGLTVYNADYGVRFELGLVDYAADDPTVMNRLSSVIDGPGFFAVVDCWDSSAEQMVRLLSMGGAELIQKSSWN